MKNRTQLEQDMYSMLPNGLTQLQILELVDYIMAETNACWADGYHVGLEVGLDEE